MKIKSYIYSDDYFNNMPALRLAYLDGRNERQVIELNCRTEDINGIYPYKLKYINVAYMEKVFYFSFSENLVFDRILFEENYIVSFKNGIVKKFGVDPIRRSFYEK